MNMPMKKKLTVAAQAAARGPLPKVPVELLDHLVNGLKGLAEAIRTAFTRTTVRTCIVPLIRNSLDYAAGRIARPSLPPCTRSTLPPANKQPSKRCRRSPMGLGEPSTNDRRALGARHTVLRLPAGHQMRYLYDQRHRELEHAIVQDHPVRRTYASLH